MIQRRFPPGWDADRVQRVLEHYESQSEHEAVAEDNAAFTSELQAKIVVPTD